MGGIIKMAFKNSLKMLSAQFFIGDIEFVDQIAALSNSSRADLIRKGTVTYAKQLFADYQVEHGITIPTDSLEQFVLDLMDTTTNAEKVVIKKKYKSVTPKAVLSTSEPMLNSGFHDVEDLEGREDIPADVADYGAPTSCPVCAADVNEIGDPELAIVKSGKDWGAWGCHACNSNGRWYDNKECNILTNAYAEAELPMSKVVK